MILSIISIVLAVMAIGYVAHCSITFQRFNDGIRDWSRSLDESTRAAIEHSAREILRQMDEAISLQRESNVESDDDSDVNENLENLDENEKDERN